MPSLTFRAGPFGPSGVKTRLLPARAARMNPRNAVPPPRVDEPRTKRTPYQANTFTMYSPSLERELITVIGLRKRECSMSSMCACQNARMYCGVFSMFSARTWRTRRVAWSVRMKSDATNETNLRRSPHHPRTADRTTCGRRRAAPAALRASPPPRWRLCRGRRSCARYE
jgi:hypothetical protein